MTTTRRRFLTLATSLLATFFAREGRRPASALGVAEWETRPVSEGDQDHLQRLMQKCVSGETSLFGQCSPLEWTRAWADQVVEERTHSLVVTRDGAVVAFMDLPPGRSRSDPSFRNAFWCGAAGVDSDLGQKESQAVIQHVVYRALVSARSMGYRRVRCAAPWPRHPFLDRDFSEYPGATVEPFVDTEGRDRYLIEWELDSAIETLRAEGARDNIQAALARN